MINSGYDIGQANHAFVFIISTDGTIEARPMPTEKTGVRMQTDNAWKKVIMGTEAKNISPASFRTNVGDNKNG